MNFQNIIRGVTLIKEFAPKKENEPSVVKKRLLEMIVVVGFEGVVQDANFAASLQGPHVLLEKLPLVPSPSLREKKLRLWIQPLDRSVGVLLH